MLIIVILAMLEKFDFFKDIYVAAYIPHASWGNAYIFWISVNVPFFGILFYFYSIDRLDQFIPTFFGFIELFGDND